MTSAYAAVATHYCKQPGCENEARSSVGRYSATTLTDAEIQAFVTACLAEARAA